MHQPVVASYCNTFLKREMQHIYRQVTGLREFRTFIMTKSRENADAFPFPNIEVLPRPRINFLLRFQRKYLQRMEPVFYRGEYDQLEGVLTRRNAQLLHVYFGHTGVHLLPFMCNWSRPSLVSFHGMDIMLRNEEPGYNHRLRALLATLPLVLARSESLGSRLMELGCDASKIRINRTGVPMGGFPYLVHSPPADGAWCIIQASRFIEKKGLEITLKACRGGTSGRPTQGPCPDFRRRRFGPLSRFLKSKAARRRLQVRPPLSASQSDDDVGRPGRRSQFDA